MVCLSVILLYYRATCLWFCNKTGVICDRPCVFSHCLYTFSGALICKMWSGIKNINIIWRLIRNAEIQTPSIDILNQNHFNKISRWFLCTESEKEYLEVADSYSGSEVISRWSTGRSVKFRKHKWIGKMTWSQYTGTPNRHSTTY